MYLSPRDNFIVESVFYSIGNNLFVDRITYLKIDVFIPVV